MVKCRECGSAELVKNGKQSSNNKYAKDHVYQNYKCKKCHSSTCIRIK